MGTSEAKVVYASIQHGGWTYTPWFKAWTVASSSLRSRLNTGGHLHFQLADGARMRLDLRVGMDSHHDDFSTFTVEALNTGR